MCLLASLCLLPGITVITGPSPATLYAEKKSSFE